MKTAKALHAASVRAAILLSLSAIVPSGCVRGAPARVSEKNVSNHEENGSLSEPAVERPRELAPETGPAPEFAFPKPVSTELKNGMHLAVIENHSLPIVQLRFVAFLGSEADGAHAGATSLLVKLLKEGGAGGLTGREILSRFESLGARLNVDVNADRTVFSVAVTKNRAHEALELLGTVISRPSLSQAEFVKLKKREIERASDRARTNGRWGALNALFRAMFGGSLGGEAHPYARTYGATAQEIDRVTLSDLKQLYPQIFTPTNSMLVLAGDIAAKDAATLADVAFTGFQGGEAKPLSFPPWEARTTPRIIVVDRPESSQSDIYVGLFTVGRQSKDFAGLSVANQILGGGVSGRLFLDVREKQSLAYSTQSFLYELKNGPLPLIAYAGTQMPKTGIAVKALLDQLQALADAAPPPAETAGSSRYLLDIFATRMETVGAVADELIQLRTLGLKDDYHAEYRRELREATPEVVFRIAHQVIMPKAATIAVAGDAVKIASMLSYFGDVVVLDPTKSFEVIRTVPKNPNAKLEVEREQGR